MDGTLIDSTAGVVGAWETFAKSYPGIDVQEILSSVHSPLSCNLFHRYSFFPQLLMVFVLLITSKSSVG